MQISLRKRKILPSQHWTFLANETVNKCATAWLWTMCSWNGSSFESFPWRIAAHMHIQLNGPVGSNDITSDVTATVSFLACMILIVSPQTWQPRHILRYALIEKNHLVMYHVSASVFQLLAALAALWRSALDSWHTIDGRLP